MILDYVCDSSIRDPKEQIRKKELAEDILRYIPGDDITNAESFLNNIDAVLKRYTGSPFEFRHVFAWGGDSISRESSIHLATLVAPELRVSFAIENGRKIVRYILDPHSICTLATFKLDKILLEHLNICPDIYLYEADIDSNNPFDLSPKLFRDFTNIRPYTSQYVIVPRQLREDLMTERKLIIGSDNENLIDRFSRITESFVNYLFK